MELSWIGMILYWVQFKIVDFLNWIIWFVGCIVRIPVYVTYYLYKTIVYVIREIYHCFNPSNSETCIMGCSTKCKDYIE